MIKNLLLLLLLSIARNAYAVHVYSEPAGVDINTTKVVHLASEINGISLRRFEEEWFQTMSIKGDRVILINSHGGNLDMGKAMISLMDTDRALGVKIICLVTSRANSMAFNLLTHCDIRLADRDALMIFHKIARTYPCPSNYIGPRLTADQLRREARDLDLDDAPIDRANAAALHMTMKQYNAHAEQETIWQPPALIRMGYLHGFGKVEK